MSRHQPNHDAARPEADHVNVLIRLLNRLAPLLALRPRRRFRKDAVLIVDGTLVPTRDHSVAEQSNSYWYSTNHQVVIDADTRLVVTVGQPLPRNHNDCKAWELSGAKAAVGNSTVIADGGYRGSGLLIPHRREPGQTELQAWQEEHNRSHRKVRARVEHTFARMKSWKILRDCRLNETASIAPSLAQPVRTTSRSPDMPTQGRHPRCWPCQAS